MSIRRWSIGVAAVAAVLLMLSSVIHTHDIYNINQACSHSLCYGSDPESAFPPEVAPKTLTGSYEPVMAASTYGDGRAVVAGDHNWISSNPETYDWCLYYDNLDLLVNVCSWLCPNLAELDYPHVAIDVTRLESYEPDFQHAKNALINAGGWSWVDVWWSGEITRERLDPPYYVLIVCNPQSAYSTSEVNAILDFVSDGNGLLFLGDYGAKWYEDSDGYYPSGASSILGPLGIAIKNNILYDPTDHHTKSTSWVKIHTFPVAHPITDGISIYMPAATATLVVTSPAIVIATGDDDTYTGCLDNDGLPEIYEIYYKAYPGAPPDVIMTEFISGETDWIEGPCRNDLFDYVLSAGQKISQFDQMAASSLFAINCRDFKETSGAPNLPLNDSSFRVALSYIYGMDDKQADIYAHTGVPWCEAIGNPIPPVQVPWYNPAVGMPNTDFDTAWAILEGNGYYIDTDNWLHGPGGERVRDMEVLFSASSSGTGCEQCDGGGIPYWEELPYSESVVGGFASNFNEFITTYLGADGPSVTGVFTDFAALVNELHFYREYDMICIGLTGLGVYVDWLYVVLHSSNDVIGGWNFAGIHDNVLDDCTETILTSLNTNTIIDAASYLQEIFVFELLPWFPIGNSLGFCTTAIDWRGELANVVSMSNYGPRNSYSWMTMYWTGECSQAYPALATALDDEPHTLNPYTDYVLYGWEIMGRALDELLVRDPATLMNTPWITTNCTVEHWVNIPELGITDGSTATFYIRQDVTWHDGYPLTAYDCVENLRVLRCYQPKRYASTWAHLVYEEADGPYKFNVYFDQTGLYYPGYVSATALLSPKHIIEAVEQQVEDGILDDFFDWNPAFNSYEDLMGVPPPAEYSFMKQIVGCGPYVFDYYNIMYGNGHVAKYEDYWINASVVGSVVGEWRNEPGTAYAYRVLVQNTALESTRVLDVKIYEDDVLVNTITDINLDPWEWTYLGPYTKTDMPCGPHTIKIEVYDAEDMSLLHTYTHTYVATIREDINTYTGELLDFTVDMRDIGRAARAFGSYPGHLRWDPPCDVNDDFVVDMRDIGSIARKFGWSC